MANRQKYWWHYHKSCLSNDFPIHSSHLCLQSEIDISFKACDKNVSCKQKEKISRLPGQPTYRDIFFHINTPLNLHFRLYLIHKIIMYYINHKLDCIRVSLNKTGTLVLLLKKWCSWFYYSKNGNETSKQRGNNWIEF